LGEELGLHLTQCGLGPGLYIRIKWHLDPSSRLATIDMGRKLGLCPFLGGAGSPSNALSPGPTPTFVPSDILIHPTIWLQYTNITDRTDRQDRTDKQTDRQQTESEPFFKRRLKTTLFFGKRTTKNMEGRNRGTPDVAMHRLHICCTMRANGSFAMRRNAAFFGCGMRKSDKGCNSRNVPHLVFCKLSLDNFRIP